MKSIRAQLEDKNLLVNKLYKDRDNWKSKVLAYRDIIRRAQATPAINSHYAILAEADKLDKKVK